MNQKQSRNSQVYIPYWEWEDYINGMWRRLPKCDEVNAITIAIEFTGNHILYGSAMKEVIIEWPKTMLNSLTNKSINRRAFLGHCACQFKINIPEYIVRAAWKQLTSSQRILADYEAEKQIKKFDNEIKNSKIHKTLGTQVLF